MAGQKSARSLPGPQSKTVSVHVRGTDDTLPTNMRLSRRSLTHDDSISQYYGHWTVVAGLTSPSVVWMHPLADNKLG